MKAIVYDEFGPPEVLHVAEVANPVPKVNEILIQVLASPAGYGDNLARNFKNAPRSEFHMPGPLYYVTRLSFGWNKPRKKILGSEFAGEVQEVGKAVTRFSAGDQVYGYVGPSMGAYAEYLTMAEDKSLAVMPNNLSYEQASSVPYGAIMAFSLLRKAPVQPGQKVLVNGASGAIGSAALQLAKIAGAEVTGVCGALRMDYVASLGADKVVDYTQESFTQNGEKYDLIFDVLGKSSFEQCKGSLRPQGRYLAVSFKAKQIWQSITTSRSDGQRVITTLASESSEALDQVRGLIEAGKYKVILDACFPMEEAAEAHKRTESGQRRGPVVISMCPAGA
jgi:NADPH:quinone reductase-like Zn-dependent oxidoreductase